MATMNKRTILYGAFSSIRITKPNKLFLKCFLQLPVYIALIIILQFINFTKKKIYKILLHVKQLRILFSIQILFAYQNYSPDLVKKNLKTNNLSIQQVKYSESSLRAINSKNTLPIFIFKRKVLYCNSNLNCNKHRNVFIFSSNFVFVSLIFLKLHINNI